MVFDRKSSNKTIGRIVRAKRLQIHCVQRAGEQSITARGVQKHMEGEGRNGGSGVEGMSSETSNQTAMRQDAMNELDQDSFF